MIRDQLPVKVFVIAPPIPAWGLEQLIATTQLSFESVGSAAAVREALPHLQRLRVDVILVDVDGGDMCESIELLRAGCAARILLLTASKDVACLDRAVLAGVRGIVRQHDAPSVMLKAIEKVHDGELWIDRNATGRIFMEMARQKAAAGADPERTKIATLTSRERQTIAAMTSDASMPAKVIAGRLCISEHTLRNHLTSIYGKLELASRLELYAFATRNRLNEPVAMARAL